MSYVSNNPVDTQGPRSLETEMRVYAIQDTVYKAFTSRYNLCDIFDYTKLRTVLSLEDVARLECLTNEIQKTVENACFERDACCWLFNSVVKCPNEYAVNRTEENATEIKGSVNLLVQTESIQKDVQNFLKGRSEDNDGLCEAIAGNDEPVFEDGEPFRVVILNSAIYILVGEGFLTYLEKTSNRLTFLSKFLKSAYAVFPVRMVNSSLWYKYYLRALAA